jgi:CubicO group peptidase (beta-lactamase class C family)
MLGFGGSIGLAAPAKQLSFAYVMNQLDANTPVDIDGRYKLMLNQIAMAINTTTCEYSIFFF